MIRTTLASIVLLIATSSALAQAPLYPTTFVPLNGQLAGGGLVAISQGIFVDADGDGDEDVLGVSYYQSAFLFIPSSNGVFAPAGAAYPTGAVPTTLVVADVDGDGDQDAVVACVGTTSPQLWTFFNDGSGGFASPPLVRNLGAVYGFAWVLHLDANAIPDLVLQSVTGAAAVLMGGPGGSYGPEIPLPGQFPNLIAFADDDGDGDVDLHYTPVGGGSLLTRRNNAGTLGPETVSASLATSIERPGFADVNGDGSLDAVVLGSQYVSGAGYPSAVQVAFGNGAGGFVTGPVQLIAGYGASSGPFLADLDADGDPDLVAYGPSPGYSFVLASYNDGTGVFGPATVIEFPGTAWWGVDEADVDADGLPDVGVFINGHVVILKNFGAAGLLGPKNVGIGGAGGLAGTGGHLFRVADLDRDGKPDAIAQLGINSSTSLSVLLDIDSSPSPQIIPIGVVLKDMALGDFNRDGVLDMILAAGPSTNAVGLLIGNGVGGFGAPAFTPTGATPVAIRAADATGDGKLDVIVLHSQLSVLPGDGGGGFGPAITTAVCAPGCGGNDALSAGDLNGDGAVDVIVSQTTVGPATATTQIWLGAGNGTFALFGGNPNPITTGVGGVLEDVNGDGALDFLQLTGNGATLSVRHGLGTGGFLGAAMTTITGPGGAAAWGVDLAVSDVNGDGWPDAVLAGGCVVANDGAGGFYSTAFHAATHASTIAIADTNRDLQKEAIVFAPSKNLIEIFRNLTPTTGTAFAFGLGCPGSGGFVPRLSAFGLPQPASTVTLRVDDSRGGAPAALLVSPMTAIISIGSGCSLFVDPASFSLVPIATFGPPFAGAGGASLAVALPAVPGPFAAAAQAIVLDPASPFSYSASNGMFFVIQ